MSDLLLAAAAQRRSAITTELADAIDFDGTNDYLSRSSDLVGNVDSKTFTFSAWVWRDASKSNQSVYQALGGAFQVALDDQAGGIQIRARDASGTEILRATGPILTNRTWVHIMASCDLSNTSRRSVYINDLAVPFTWSTYTDRNIDFTVANHFVATWQGAPSYAINSRLAHLYLDYTYRDLSIEANRRLFITADRKPAKGQADLNPILYLPLDDPEDPGYNAGTGGHFTLNGVVARSGRGPSQFNAPYSDLDGSADYLSRGQLLSITDSKSFTLSFVVSFDVVKAAAVVYFGNSSARKFSAHLTVSNRLEINCRNAAGTLIFNANAALNNNTIRTAANLHVVLSVNLNSPSKPVNFLFANGVNAGHTSSYVNDFIDFTETVCAVGCLALSTPTDFIDGRLGNVFFDTRYIDLSNPDNLAKFVTGTGIDAKPVDLGANGELPFDTPPLIYLPMYGNNAGKNYGSGGDFTVNSGPFPGARGPSEYWGNKADFSGSTGNLYRNKSLDGSGTTKTFSSSFWITKDTAKDHRILRMTDNNDASYAGINIEINPSNQLKLYGHKSSFGSNLLDATVTSPTLSNGTAYYVQLCIDLTDPNKRFVYINGVLATVTWSTYTNGVISLVNVVRHRIGFAPPDSYFDGKLSEFYFTTDYIDFSQEASRLKFMDAFGNPVAILPQIEAGELPDPAIYMRFDPANFGKNYGTGGDFTVNGTITDGGQL